MVNFWSKVLVIVKRTGILIWLLSIATALIEQHITKNMELELSSLEGTSNIVWFYATGSVLLSLISPLISLILVVTSLQSKSILKSLSQYLNQVLIENFRASGKILWWSLLFLIPGVIRFLQLSFVSFVVLLDPQYQNGNKDALSESTKLVNKSFFKLTMLFIFFAIIIPIIQTAWDEYEIFSIHPISAFFLTGLNSLISIVFVLLLLNQWEKNRGTHVQLATH